MVGKVSLTIPKLGYLFHYARQPVGFCLLVVLPAGLLIAFEIRRISKHARTPLAREASVSNGATHPLPKTGPGPAGE